MTEDEEIAKHTLMDQRWLQIDSQNPRKKFDF